MPSKYPTGPDAYKRSGKARPGRRHSRLNLTAPHGTIENSHRIVGGTDLGQTTKLPGKKKY